MKTVTSGSAGTKTNAQASASAKVQAKGKIGHTYLFEALDPQGNLKWSLEQHNVVADVGLDDILDKYYKGSSYTAAHYVGLIDGTPTVAGSDTMGSHTGWAEITAYDETNRPALNLGTVSNQAVDNSASKATYTISTNGTAIGGSFIVTDNTKGGTGGTLVSAVAFDSGTDKTLDAGDTLNVSVTATMADAV